MITDTVLQRVRALQVIAQERGQPLAGSRCVGCFSGRRVLGADMPAGPSQIDDAINAAKAAALSGSELAAIEEGAVVS